ncbi:MAG: hypothetical protein VB855_06710, partial [Pirellulaceae bacterium]
MGCDKHGVPGTQQPSQRHKLSQESEIIQNHQLLLKRGDLAVGARKRKEPGRTISQVPVLPAKILDRRRLSTTAHALANQQPGTAE